MRKLQKTFLTLLLLACCVGGASAQGNDRIILDSATLHALGKDYKRVITHPVQTQSLGRVRNEPSVRSYTARHYNGLDWAIKTNAVLDLALIPNIGVEVGVGNGYTFNFNWHYAWWNNDCRHRYYSTYGGELGFRRWLSGETYSGHRLGLYTQVVTYDFEFGGTGYQSPDYFDTFAVGIDYGYAFVLGERLRLDVGIGVGFLHMLDYEYVPRSDYYYLQATHVSNLFVPTKLEASLIWRMNP